MDTIILNNPESSTAQPQPQVGVVRNPNGGYHIRVKLKEQETVIDRPVSADSLVPLDTPRLAEMSVFEDCVLLSLQEGGAIIIHVSDPQVRGSVVYFYHPNGILWRAVPIEQLNPGWVFSIYYFRGDLREFNVHIRQMRSRVARPSRQQQPTFWATGGWQAGVVFIPGGLVERVRAWQHSSLPAVQPLQPSDEQVKRLEQAYPADVDCLLALQAQGVDKVTYQIGGLHLVLSYIERLGLADIVNRYCPRQGELSEGVVISVLVINRLLASCALSQVADWVAKTGLHWLLGVADPFEFNYDRLADALLAVSPHWQTIATQLTLQAVKQFGLKVETIHYDLTSVFFHGEYDGSEWVTFGYSRDKRPDKPQVNIGLSTTADGEVVLPGASGIHAGNVNDATTTVSVHQRLHTLFQRSDLLVTGDRIMQSAENMLRIAQAHGRFLGPVDWTPYISRVVAGCPDDSFVALPLSSQVAGHTIKATFRRLHFKVKLELSQTEREQLAQQRKQRRQPGAPPRYREVHFRVRAAILLDTDRQQADATRRVKQIEAYETELKWTLDHLNQGRYYSDPDWV